jgi:hypothetical protein
MVSLALKAGISLKWSSARAESSSVPSNPVGFRQISQPVESKYEFMGLSVTVNFWQYGYFATYPRCAHE